jgi:hypothetical protein
LSKAAAASSLSALETIVGASIGGVFFICMLGAVLYKLYQRKLLHEKRKRRLSTVRNRTEDRTSVYGVVAIKQQQQGQYMQNLAYTNRRNN